MKRITKKDLALSLKSAGRSVEEIAEALKCSPTYVANVLIASGKPTEYSDLYTTATVQNAYAKVFQGVLRFRDVAAAKESVAKIDAIYHRYAEDRDRRGQHQAQLMALIGKNRAEGIGKFEEAKIFAGWLISHLDVTQNPVSHRQPPLPFEEEDSPYDQMSPYEATLAFA